MRSARELVEAALAEVQTLSADQARALHGTPGVLFVDIRESAELRAGGTIPGALHAPRGLLEFWADPSSQWRQRALVEAPRCVLFCAIGWRSALAAKALQDMGRAGVSHLGGGFEAWRAAGGPVQELPPSKRAS
jgi:rhodanese-related sulfurtransferase